MVKKKSPVVREPGSEKVWLDEQRNLFWMSVRLRDGRVTRQFNGPLALTIDEAREALNGALRM